MIKDQTKNEKVTLNKIIKNKNEKINSKVSETVELNSNRFDWKENSVKGKGIQMHDTLLYLPCSHTVQEFTVKPIKIALDTDL